MWKLERVYAKNLCAFHEVDYNIQPSCTTLIFGNNLDNDSQASNGSGKSALIEAISIGLTGETLRKIKMDEIINDMSDEAIVSLLLSNDETGQKFHINRRLSRKKPQEITTSFLGNCGEESEPIVQSSVADYNKFILETLGLSKDDIYSNFILSKHKYVSFLSSSDRDKKEIINRFSNGIIVDEAIEALVVDMEPLQQQLKEAESLVANYSGRVSAIDDQIANALVEATEKSQNKAKRIEELNHKIASKRAFIREQENAKTSSNTNLDNYDIVDQELQDLENSEKSLVDSQNTINKLFTRYKLTNTDNFEDKIAQCRAQLSSLEEKQIALKNKLEAQNDKLNEASVSYNSCLALYKEFNGTYDTKVDGIKKEMKALGSSIKVLETEQDKLQDKRNDTNALIANLEKQLAGVISCPKCKHEFTLSDNIDIDDARSRISQAQSDLDVINATIIENKDKIDDCTQSGRNKRKELDGIENEKAQLSSNVAKAQTSVNEIQKRLSEISGYITDVSYNISNAQKSIDAARKHLFDQAFEILDAAIKSEEDAISKIDIEISNANGIILSYKETIKETEHSSETNMTDSLKESKKKYEKELNKAISDKEEIERQFNELKVQEATFIEFKTHLANTKINDLSCITNNFLEAIGSDIRIAFSGYTVLKSGKIRDKISISLIRDGVDCGSFDKFSEGEKARVNLANILAMHKLTNVNCLDGKGLDLLILDEILEATDESGLANIFEALNSLRITSLVVSHGNIAENYPYKLVVNKQNGVSFINENSK